MDDFTRPISRFVLNNQLEVETVVARPRVLVTRRSFGGAALAHFARRLARRRTLYTFTFHHYQCLVKRKLSFVPSSSSQLLVSVGSSIKAASTNGILPISGKRWSLPSDVLKRKEKNMYRRDEQVLMMKQ